MEVSQEKSKFVHFEINKRNEKNSLGTGFHVFYT